MNHLDDEYGDCGVNVHRVKPTRQNIAFPKDYASFHAFPSHMGWYIDDNYKLHPRTARGESSEPWASFLQSWLFFGLIFTLVRTNTELLTYDDLVQDQSVDTKNLRQALEKWAAWEKANKSGIEFRMIWVEMVLDKARQVVRNNCALINGQTGYSDQDGSVDHMSDVLALSLMTLGETLSAVKAKIMADVDGAYLKGWHSDDDSGWGPPKYVFDRMADEGWCRRAIHLLRGQLRSNAILLLAAYNSQKGSPSVNKEDHVAKKCTEDVCNVKSESETGRYVSRHAPGCKDPACAKAMVGPTEKQMDAIGDMLDNGSIPLMRFSEGVGEDIALEPFDWTRGTEFVAISHVWSHGYGAEKKNALFRCQLVFIRKQLTQVRNLMRNDNSQGQCPPFWMDTLVVPVERKFEAQREIAISQIFKVFHESACTLVLDLGLSTMTAGHDGKPAQAAMKVLSSGWMRRLWTLQEAFSSKKIYLPFQANEAGFNHIKEFDELTSNLGRTQETLTSALITTLRNQLLHNVMGHERRTRELYLWNSVQPPPRQGALLIANAWRAARWRVSPAHLQ